MGVKWDRFAKEMKSRNRAQATISQENFINGTSKYSKYGKIARKTTNREIVRLAA